MDNDGKSAAYIHVSGDGSASKVNPKEINEHIAAREQQEATMKAMPLHVSAEIAALSLASIAKTLAYFMERDREMALSKAMAHDPSKVYWADKQDGENSPPAKPQPTSLGQLKDILSKMDIKVVRFG